MTFSIIHLFFLALFLLVPIAVIITMIAILRRNQRL